MPTSTAAKIEQVPSEEKSLPKLRFPKGYDPDSLEVKERRRKLFADIARNRTPETDLAMTKISAMFANDDSLA